MFINRSFVSGVTGTGVVVDGTGGGSEINMNNSVITENGTGLQAAAGGSMRISNSDISFNGTGLSVAGSISSFGNNRITSNTVPGPAPVPAGGVSTEFGQQ
jgi:hypothetical protein